MSDQNCNLIFTGRIVDGMSITEVHENLAEIFKTDIEKIQALFSDKRTVVKKNVTGEMGLKMQKMLLEAGAECDIEPVIPDSPADVPPEVPQPPPTPDQSEPASVRPAPSNPYAAPQASLKTEIQSDDRFTEPQKRPASHGVSWLIQAFSLFMKSPFMWILAVFIYGLMSLIQIIPILGPIVLNLLNPAFLAGFIRGAKRLDEEGELSPGCIFQGFNNNFGQLLLLGLLFLVGMIILVVIAGIMLFAVTGGNFTDMEPDGMSMLATSIIPLAVLFFGIPIFMCYMFSPLLINLHDKSVFEAIGISFKACIKNFLPFLVYGLVYMGIVLAFILLVGLLIGLISFVAGQGALSILPVLIMIPMFLVVVPVSMLVMYTSYKDIFYNN